MILKRDEWNNGYGCSCCRSDWENVEWIEESDMKSFSEIVNYVFNRKYLTDNNIHAGLIYEKDGKVLYGFSTRIYKAGNDAFIYIEENKYQINCRDKMLKTKEEIHKLNIDANFPGQFMDWKKQVEAN